MANLTQLPSDVDLSFVAGDTFRIRVRVVTPGTGVAVSLDNYVFTAEIADSKTRAIVAQFTVDPDPDAMDPDTGSMAVILTLPPAETAALPSLGNGSMFSGIWDLEVRFPVPVGETVPDVRTVASGSVTCIIDVSNPGD